MSVCLRDDRRRMHTSMLLSRIKRLLLRIWKRVLGMLLCCSGGKDEHTKTIERELHNERKILRRQKIA
ncbi:hypothetical protein Y032_0102g3499 [Ancylostoma ceylanicum]|uniref:Uncharacterized protein n=1 Tax=Ancylostoma ceylanicum TaxID=53326 RepID=A0A016THG8_9BILA|nr:hypothetical protein Y032_0102g3499 [Ancylostoma ceylanicum]